MGGAQPEQLELSSVPELFCSNAAPPPPAERRGPPDRDTNRGGPSEEMPIQGLLQQAMTLQGIQLQIIEITHGLGPLSRMEPSVAPGRLGLHQPAHQLLHRQRWLLRRSGGIPDQRQGQALRSGRTRPIQAEACRELAAITAEWRLDLEIGAIQGTGRRVSAAGLQPAPERAGCSGIAATDQSGDAAGSSSPVRSLRPHQLISRCCRADIRASSST